MGKVANPAAYARVLSLERANARAKACKHSECISDDTKGALHSYDISRRTVSMRTTVPSSSSSHTRSSGSNQEDCLSKTDIRGHLVRDMSFSDLKPLFSSISERIDRRLDLWEQDFSSVSSDSSNMDGSRAKLDGYTATLDNCASSELPDEVSACAEEVSTISSSTFSDTSSVNERVLSNELSMNLVKMEETCPPQHDRSEDGEHDERSNHCCKPCTYKRNSCAKEKGLQNLHAGDGFIYPLKLEETRTEVGFKTEEQDSTTILTELPLNSVAVEKVSINPEQDFRESMYEMMVEKGDVEEDMEELLNCYLMLNPAELHQTIRETFSRVWIDIIMTIR